RGDTVEKRPQRNRRRAVRSLEECRDTLAHVVVGGRDVEDAAARVRVRIDEAGRDDLARRVNDTRRRRPRRIDAWRDAHDRVAANPDVASVPRTAGTVDDAAVAD